MKYLPRCIAALFAFGLIAMSTGPAPALQTPGWQHGHGQNLSGQYSGSVSDSVLGTGTAIANFAGAGVALGGYFVFTFGSTNYDNPTIAGGGRDGLQANGYRGGGGDNVFGAFESTIASTACEFAYSASYSSSDNELTGKYKAINGCSGETGTFTLTQACYYSSGRQDSVRREGGGLTHC
ncbi:MAG TPA: hypothetical protein VKR56_05830 [Candidatus Cybelea sp.]|jgi:hypothetical protein|nr:hypothetical protein [Candidatus Cybelea sp.]